HTVRAPRRGTATPGERARKPAAPSAKPTGRQETRHLIRKRPNHGSPATVSGCETPPRQAGIDISGDRPMSRNSNDAIPSPDPRIANVLGHWLALGALALLMLPPARGELPWLGSGPYWLLLAPAIALAVLYRGALAA